MIGYVCRVSRRVSRLGLCLQPDYGSAAVVEAGAANNGRPYIDPRDPMQGRPYGYARGEDWAGRDLLICSR